MKNFPLFILFYFIIFLSQSEEELEYKIPDSWQWKKTKQDIKNQVETTVSKNIIFPKYLSKIFGTKKEVIGEKIEFVLPQNFSRYFHIIEKTRRKNFQWLKDYVNSISPKPPSEILPWHENLSVSKEEYEEILLLWKQRKLFFHSRVLLSLKENADFTWKIRSSGTSFSNFIYDPDKDIFASPSGTLVRKEDFVADNLNALGKWKGHWWSLKKESSLGTRIEDIAIGGSEDNKYIYLVHKQSDFYIEPDSYFSKVSIIRIPIQDRDK